MVEKNELHKRNKHRGEYDLPKLSSISPTLSKYIIQNKYGALSINFFDPQSVKELNKALLALHYGITYWDLPPHSLCPPIPGRADYIHYVSDLIGLDKQGVRCLDIGVGANCIYPIIGCVEYNWAFVGSDIDVKSLKNAQKIVDNNPILRDKVELRVQNDKKSIFSGIITSNDFFDIVVCNPPFHDSAESAMKGSVRKIKALKGVKTKRATLNFGGNSNELWCEGGELYFISQMIKESRLYRDRCNWFTCLVSKDDNLKALKIELKNANVVEHKTLDMRQGNKISRVLAWHY